MGSNRQVGISGRMWRFSYMWAATAFMDRSVYRALRYTIVDEDLSYGFMGRFLLLAAGGKIQKHATSPSAGAASGHRITASKFS